VLVPELTDKELCRRAFHAAPDLTMAIKDSLAAHNDELKPV
jgi:hypothetical protein